MVSFPLIKYWSPLLFNTVTQRKKRLIEDREVDVHAPGGNLFLNITSFLYLSEKDLAKPGHWTHRKTVQRQQHIHRVVLNTESNTIFLWSCCNALWVSSASFFPLQCFWHHFVDTSVIHLTKWEILQLLQICNISDATSTVFPTWLLIIDLFHDGHFDLS